MREQTVGTAEFKARCLELVDRVAATGNAIIITKRGKPVARLAPVASRWRSLVGALKGHVRITGDIIAPIDASWEAGRQAAPLRHPPADLARSKVANLSDIVPLA
jgi:prevent-host-death family protein